MGTDPDGSTPPFNLHPSSKELNLSSFQDLTVAIPSTVSDAEQLIHFVRSHRDVFVKAEIDRAGQKLSCGRGPGQGQGCNQDHGLEGCSVWIRTEWRRHLFLLMMDDPKTLYVQRTRLQSYLFGHGLQHRDPGTPPSHTVANPFSDPHAPPPPALYYEHDHTPTFYEAEGLPAGHVDHFHYDVEAYASGNYARALYRPPRSRSPTPAGDDEDYHIVDDDSVHYTGSSFTHDPEKGGFGGDGNPIGDPPLWPGSDRSCHSLWGALGSRSPSNAGLSITISKITGCLTLPGLEEFGLADGQAVRRAAVGTALEDSLIAYGCPISNM
ncbi:hypothetical protein C8R44DRAFT_733061 [Mycena epipterygia]|nr:hypothetical protein C8R44DRAFT_733061 [Mycena epipterygia]